MKKTRVYLVLLALLFVVTPTVARAAGAIEAICEGARTGQIGDGKIFVTDLGECVRIRTGERGSAAIG